MVLGDYATIPAYFGPCDKDWVSIERRERSFIPCGKEFINAKVFAEAGFYFLEDPDALRCFCCGIVLESWNENDNPWIEHAKHEKDCPHLYLNKGWEFICMARSSDIVLLQSTHEIQSSFHKCVICFERKIGVTYYPCEHAVVCRLCAACNDEGPYCRSIIRFALRTNIV
ncbi:baculoviral IAP repeat-containing protein 8-like [Brevipalpus obovatus]|uniref:baculoviral IAP repeat-containing protein 8-like n=1 Tax=Brevipalpus obovatus TaxID=246614 RepID=UPI003D9EC10A